MPLAWVAVVWLEHPYPHPRPLCSWGTLFWGCSRIEHAGVSDPKSWVRNQTPSSRGADPHSRGTQGAMGPSPRRASPTPACRGHAAACPGVHPRNLAGLEGDGCLPLPSDPPG